MAEGGGRSSAGGLGDGEGGDDGLLLTAEGVAGPFGGLAHADAISLASWWAADGADAAPAGTQASAALQQLDAKIRALIAAAERQPVCGSAPALPLPPPFPPPSLPDRVQLLALSDAATSLDTSAGLHMRDLLPAGQAAALSALRGLGLRAADLDDASDEQTDEGDAQRPATVRRAGAASAARSELGRICARQGGAGGSSGAFSSTALVTAAPQSTAMTVAAATPCVARTPLPTPALNQVPTVAQEREAATAAAAADDARLGARVQRLLGVVATVNAEAEMLQYGALLKPLLESTTHVMANAVAADGTAGVLQRALQQRQARAQDAQARVGTVLRKAQHERRAAAAARYGLKEVLPPSPTAVTLAAAGDAAADDFVIPAPSRPASAGGMRRGGGRNTGDTLDGGDDDDEDGNEDGGSSGRLLQPPPLPAPPAPAHRVAPVSPPPAAPPPPAAIIFSADDDAATTATHSVGGERRTSAMQLGAALAVLAGGAGSSRGSDADRRRRQTATSAANSRDAALRRFAATHRAHEAAKAQQRVDFDADQAAKEQADAAAEARQLARQRRAVDLAALMRGKQAARRHQAAAAAPQASSEQQQLPPPPPPLPQLAIDVDDSSLPSPAHSPMTPGSPPALLTLRSARSVIPSAPLPALRRATSVVPWDLLEDLEGDRARLAEG